MPKAVVAHVCLFMVALIYGANYTIAKEILDGEFLQPTTLTLFRVLAGAVLFWTLQAMVIKQRIQRSDLGWLFLCGLFGVALNQLMFITGLKYTTHIRAALIMTTTPILVLVVSLFLLKEAITLKRLAGILLGITGAVLLIIHGKKFAYTKSGWNGDVLIFINALSYGIYLVLVKRLIEKYHPITVITWVFSFGCLIVLPIGIPELNEIQMHTFTPSIWLAVAYVLLCTTFLAYLLNAYALQLVSPTVVSIYIYLQPLLATSIALVLGKDTLDGVKVAAGGLIFLGVYLVSQRTEPVSVQTKADSSPR